MEFHLLVDLTIIFFLSYLRFNAFYPKTSWYYFTGYILTLFLLFFRTNWTAHMVVIHFAELAIYEKNYSSWILDLANFYKSFDPFIQLFLLLVTCEIIAWLIHITYKLSEKHNFRYKSAGIGSNWFANLAVFIAMPALAYTILDILELFGERVLFKPIILVYLLPAYILGFDTVRDDHFSGSYSIFNDIGIDDFYSHAGPWLIICYIISIIYFLKKRNTLQADFKGYFFGDIKKNKIISLSHFYSLPWRGKLLIVFSVTFLSLIILSWLTEIIIFLIIAFFYTALITVPIIILFSIFLFFLLKKPNK